MVQVKFLYRSVFGRKFLSPYGKREEGEEGQVRRERQGMGRDGKERDPQGFTEMTPLLPVDPTVPGRRPISGRLHT